MPIVLYFGLLKAITLSVPVLEGYRDEAGQVTHIHPLISSLLSLSFYYSHQFSYHYILPLSNAVISCSIRKKNFQCSREILEYRFINLPFT